MSSAIRYEDGKGNQFYVDNAGTSRSGIDNMKMADKMAKDGWENVVIVDEEDNIIYEV